VPRFDPTKRRVLIRGLRDLGFTGPHTGTRHQFMSKGDLDVRIPNPHGSDIGEELLREILRQAGIDRDTWERM
jgi:predicted RNA binding protein YcfA (HicA-like mRNA interferase family)